MKICILGLGYIGLPTAVTFAKHGVQVHGVDVNPHVVNTLNNKELHIEELGLKEAMIEALNKGTFTISTQPEVADAYIISVPTPLTLRKNANLHYVEHAAQMIVPYLKKGDLVILESTVPPRTLEDLLIPILKQTPFAIGEELFVSHAPERVLPGKLFQELVDNDRIVGGINKKSSQMTADLYKYFVKGKIHITDATTAEMVKLMENTYRDVNIAYANELARIAERIGFNVWEAIKLANSHPRVHIHNPGPGVGGHCIAVDPWFIVEKAPEESTLIAVARHINEFTPHHVVKLISGLVQHINNPLVTLLGLTFKENIDDLRGSPALTIMNELKHIGLRLKIYDPHVQQQVEGTSLTLEDAVDGSDCLVILTGHEEFKKINFSHIKDLLRTKIIFDTRNICDEEELTLLGYKYLQIGLAMHQN